MGYSDDMKEKPVEQQLGFRKSMRILNEEKVQKYLDEVFEFEPHVKTIELLKPDEHGYRVVIHGTKIGHIIGKRGWILKLLTDTVNCKFSISVRFTLKEMEQ